MIILRNKIFARADYEGLNEKSKEFLRKRRKQIADETRKAYREIGNTESRLSNNGNSYRNKFSIGGINGSYESGLSGNKFTENYTTSGNSNNSKIFESKFNKKISNSHIFDKTIPREDFIKYNREGDNSLLNGVLRRAKNKSRLDAELNQVSNRIESGKNIIKKLGTAGMIAAGVGAAGGLGYLGYRAYKKHNKNKK